LSIDFGGDQTVAIRIEARGRAHFVLEAALQRERGSGGEAHQEVPNRPNKELLEEHATGHRGAKGQRARKRASHQHPGRPEADE